MIHRRFQILRWCCACVALSVTPLSAQEPDEEAARQADVAIRSPNPGIPLDDAFPDDISPSHVYSKIDRLDRSLDRLLAARGLPAQTLPADVDTGLTPMHGYQPVLSCSNRLQELDDQLDVFAVPTITVRPTEYAPRDVFFVVITMRENVERIATNLKVEDLPSDELTETGKTPTDVFGVAIRVFVKLNALSGHDELRPAEVYAQMVRGVEDVKSILRQNDPACRYRINKPASLPERKPADVFQKCLEIRSLINRHRTELDMPTIPVPDPPDYEVRPRDVFLQTQIIIAELNLLKMRLNTVSTTPLPVPVGADTTPTDVHGQATMIEYLLTQAGDVADKSAATTEPARPQGPAK